MKKLLITVMLACMGVLATNAQELSANLNKAKSTFLNGEYESALQQCEGIISGETDSLELAMAHSYAGLACQELNRNEEAVEHYKEAIRMDVPRLDIYDQLINLTSSVDDADNYEWALMAKLKAFPDFKSDISQSLAQHYLKQKKYDALLTEAGELNAMFPDNAKFIYYEALAYQNMEKEEEAYERYVKILKIDPEHVGAHLGAGIYQYKKGSIMFSQEKKKYESKKSPSRVDYTNYLKSLEEAKAVYRDALNHLLVAYNDGGKSSLKGAIFNIYTRLGEKENAEKYK